MTAETKNQERNEFSVVQFYANDKYEYIVRFIGSQEAVAKAVSTIQNAETKFGEIKKVIITDGGDFTVFEWQYEKGIVWPILIKKKNDRQT